jgi:hypothetical protein
LLSEKDSHQYDRAGHGQRHAEDQRSRPVPSQRPRKNETQDSGDYTLSNGSRDGNAAHSEQLFDVELKADAEHQQNDADLRQVLGQGCVGDESRRVRAHQRTREQVADDRRKADALGEVAQYQGRTKASRNRQDEIVTMHVIASRVSWGAPGADTRAAGALTRWSSEARGSDCAGTGFPRGTDGPWILSRALTILQRFCRRFPRDGVAALFARSARPR